MGTNATETDRYNKTVLSANVGAKERLHFVHSKRSLRLHYVPNMQNGSNLLEKASHSKYHEKLFKCFKRLYFCIKEEIQRWNFNYHHHAYNCRLTSLSPILLWMNECGTPSLWIIVEWNFIKDLNQINLPSSFLYKRLTCCSANVHVTCNTKVSPIRSRLLFGSFPFYSIISERGYWLKLK